MTNMLMQDGHSPCEYCRGNTKIDDYGQCKACGAPKPMPASYYQPRVIRNMPQAGGVPPQEWRSVMASTTAMDMGRMGTTSWTVE